MELHHTSTGEAGPRIAFCHGLFGQGRNWSQIAKGLADISRPTTFDLPNHGRSPWTERFDYVEMAEILAENLAAIGGDEPWVVVGHSMGGKVVMLLALLHPELVDRLAVVDMAPDGTGGSSEFRGYIDGMAALDLPTIDSRADADHAMSAVTDDPGVRAFLLQNLRREGGGWRWQANLEVLGRDLDRITGWPAERVEQLPPFAGPVLWLVGEDSPYVGEEHEEPMRRLFPRARLVVVNGAGHWVHSEKPEVATAALRALLRKD